MEKKFALIARFKVTPGHMDTFMAEMMKNAVAARRDEPDCHEFRVMTSEDEPDTVTLFEVYSRPGAIDHHRETPHYKAFRKACDPIIEDRHVTTFELHL